MSAWEPPSHSFSRVLAHLLAVGLEVSLRAVTRGTVVRRGRTQAASRKLAHADCRGRYTTDPLGPPTAILITLCSPVNAAGQ